MCVHFKCFSVTGGCITISRKWWKILPASFHPVSSVLSSCLVLCLVILFCQFTLLSVCLFASYLASHPVCLSVCLCMLACLSAVCLHACLSVCLSKCCWKAHQKQFSFRAFSSSAPKLWNALPQTIKEAETPWRRPAQTSKNPPVLWMTLQRLFRFLYCNHHDFLSIPLLPPCLL